MADGAVLVFEAPKALYHFDGEWDLGLFGCLPPHHLRVDGCTAECNTKGNRDLEQHLNEFKARAPNDPPPPPQRAPLNNSAPLGGEGVPTPPPPKNTGPNSGLRPIKNFSGLQRQLVQI